ncbi:MAG: guanylate kinase [bacterium]|nr:guanylate kinase [bacterium]
MNGKFVIITGPSGSGKTALVTSILTKIPHSTRLVTTTTRVPRPGEKDDYFFVLREEFEKGIKNEDFFEYAEVYGNLYGSSKKALESSIRKYEYVFVIIDVKGAQTLKSKIPHAVVFFISPGTIEDIHDRLLRFRSGISKDELEKRLNTATYELSVAPHFDHIIDNKEGHFKHAVTTLMSLIHGK